MFSPVALCDGLRVCWTLALRA